MYKPKNLLVTGGMGFIGSHFIELACKNENVESVVNIDKLTYAASQGNISRLSAFRKHEFIQADICDANTIAAVLREYSIDTIVNFAAESHVDNSINSPQDFINTNILGTFCLLEEARKYWAGLNQFDSSRFHHVSTDEVYGSINKEQTAPTENAAYNPSSPYSSSKAGSDHIVQAYHKTYAMPTTMSHCSNNYGTYQHDEKFIPVVINACMSQQDIPIYGDGSNIRDWIHVQDHCLAIWSVLEKGRLGQKYNIPGEFEISNIDLAKMICSILNDLLTTDFDFLSLIRHVEDRLGHDWRYAIDGEKIHTECEWRPTMQFYDGLKDTITWYIAEYAGSSNISKFA